MYAETAETQTPVSMPAMSTAWDKLEIEHSELDPAALAKALAHLDIDDDEEKKAADDKTSTG